LQYCSFDETVDPQVTAVLTGDIDRSFVTRRPGSAIPDHYARSMELIRQTESVRHLHIGELATLVECPELVSLARAANWTISLDCAWDTGAMSAPEALSVIKAVDVFMPNDAEMSYLEEVGVSVHSASLTVVKKGSAGAVAYSAEGESVAPAIRVDCVDATGAGDAFNAGFLHFWMQGRVIEQCLMSGNRCGAFAVSQLSGIGA